MTFLNGVLLGGLAAAAIPLLLHLLHRSRFRTVPWGAMHLLESVLHRNRRRIRLEQLILLLVRCSIPALLALCMARPVLKGSRELLGDSPTSTVLLLDDSGSMQAGPPGRAAIDQAREAAGRVLDGLAPGSEAAAVRMAGSPAALLDGPTFDLSRLRDEIARARTVFAPARVPEALQAAAAELARMHHAHREVVILTDFQRASWTEEEATARARALEALRRGPARPNLTLFHVPPSRRENVSVDSLDLPRRLLGTGQRLQVRANLRNHGETERADLRLVFRVDGRERAVSRLTLGPREQGQVLFTHTFDSPGSHVIEVASDADSLPADDSALASVPVWSRVPVLLVSGDPNPEPLLGETDFAEIALRPFGAARAEPADLVVPRVIEVRDLDARALSEARVVLLANVPQLGDAPLRALEEFVREGGGLLLFPGNRINSAWYNATLHAEGKGLLPLPAASLAGTLGGTGGSAAVLSQHYEHPALEIFNDPRNGSLSDAQIRVWYRLREPAARAASPAPSILARLDSGDPFLVEKRFGEGRVIQCCVPCDGDWTNLPLRPAYLPLLQQLVTYLASQVFPPRNIPAGAPLAAFLPAADAGKTALLRDPEGRTHDLPVALRGSRGAAEFPRASAPGLYTLEVPGGERIHFVAEPDRRESDLRPLDEAEIAAIARSLDAKVVRTWEEYRRLEEERRYGREVWPLLLAFVLALIFAELVLERRFARAGP